MAHIAANGLPLLARSASFRAPPHLGSCWEPRMASQSLSSSRSSSAHSGSPYLRTPKREVKAEPRSPSTRQAGGVFIGRCAPPPKKTKTELEVDALLRAQEVLRDPEVDPVEFPGWGCAIEASMNTVSSLPLEDALAWSLKDYAQLNGCPYHDLTGDDDDTGPSGTARVKDVDNWDDYIAFQWR